MYFCLYKFYCNSYLLGCRLLLRFIQNYFTYRRVWHIILILLKVYQIIIYQSINKMKNKRRIKQVVTENWFKKKSLIPICFLLLFIMWLILKQLLCLIIIQTYKTGNFFFFLKLLKNLKNSYFWIHLILQTLFFLTCYQVWLILSNLFLLYWLKKKMLCWCFNIIY